MWNKSCGILITWKRLRSIYEVIKKGKIMKIAMKILGSVIAFSVMIILWVLALVISVGIPTVAILFILDAVKLINIW